MYSKKLKCDNPSCQWEGYMRTKCKNKESEYYKKYLCPYHASIESVSKKKTPKQKRTEEVNSDKRAKRNEYFEYHIDRCYKSEESGKSISEPTRLNICHILPKSLFPSIQAELSNCIYLTGDEHTRIDVLIFAHRWEDIEKEFPKSWELIKIRVQSFLDKIEENHGMLRSLKDYLGWI